MKEFGNGSDLNGGEDCNPKIFKYNVPSNILNNLPEQTNISLTNNNLLELMNHFIGIFKTEIQSHKDTLIDIVNSLLDDVDIKTIIDALEPYIKEYEENIKNKKEVDELQCFAHEFSETGLFKCLEGIKNAISNGEDIYSLSNKIALLNKENVKKDLQMLIKKDISEENVKNIKSKVIDSLNKKITSLEGEIKNKEDIYNAFSEEIEKNNYRIKQLKEQIAQQEKDIKDMSNVIKDDISEEKKDSINIKKREIQEQIKENQKKIEEFIRQNEEYSESTKGVDNLKNKKQELIWCVNAVSFNKHEDSLKELGESYDKLKSENIVQENTDLDHAIKTILQEYNHNKALEFLFKEEYSQDKISQITDEVTKQLRNIGNNMTILESLFFIQNGFFFQRNKNEENSDKVNITDVIDGYEMKTIQHINLLKVNDIDLISSLCEALPSGNDLLKMINADLPSWTSGNKNVQKNAEQPENKTSWWQSVKNFFAHPIQTIKDYYNNNKEKVICFGASCAATLGSLFTGGSSLLAVLCGGLLWGVPKLISAYSGGSISLSALSEIDFWNGNSLDITAVCIGIAGLLAFALPKISDTVNIFASNGSDINNLLGQRDNFIQILNDLKLLNDKDVGELQRISDNISNFITTLKNASINILEDERNVEWLKKRLGFPDREKNEKGKEVEIGIKKYQLRFANFVGCVCGFMERIKYEIKQQIQKRNQSLGEHVLLNNLLARNNVLRPENNEEEKNSIGNRLNCSWSPGANFGLENVLCEKGNNASVFDGDLCNAVFYKKRGRLLSPNRDEKEDILNLDCSYDEGQGIIL